MSDAENAYAVAEKKIAKAIAAEATELFFNSDDTRALEAIPPSIRDATELRRLSFSRTQITDITPLAGMTEITYLDLSETQITDIAPLSGMTGMIELDLNGTPVVDISHIMRMTEIKALDVGNTQAVDLRPVLKLGELPIQKSLGRGLEMLLFSKLTRGLHFDNCKACKIDPRIAEIASIKEHAERAKALFSYLEHWVPPVDESSLPAQSDIGLSYGVNEDGLIDYHPDGKNFDSADIAEFHTLVVAEALSLSHVCHGGRNLPYKPLGDMLDRYHASLGANVPSMSVALAWKLGNDLRLVLKSNVERRKDDLEDMPPLGIDMRNALDGLVQSHNVLCELHPRMKMLDHASIDPLERHRAEQNRALLDAAVVAFSQQVTLLRAEIIRDLEDLNREAQSETQAALRAMRIEQESIENLIKAILVQGVRDSKDEKLIEKIGGDLRGWATGGVAGAAATALGPEIAANYPMLVAQLQPQIAAVLSALHGQDYPLSDAVKYVTARVTNAGKEPPPE